MNPTNIQVLQNDYGYQINFTLQDSQGNVFSLADTTSILFNVQIAGLDALKFSGELTVLNPIAGTCYYTVGQDDFDSAGTYNAAIQVNFVNEQVTFNNITVAVLPNVPHQ